MNYNQLLKSDNILLQSISGSNGYGLQIATSDVDTRGIFYQPIQNLFGFNPIDQIADEKNDNLYYELSKFFDLLIKNNPNILELLASPIDCILHRNPILDLIKVDDVLSKLCSKTFGQYAFGQIKKARGLNKKVVNPVDEKRKSILDFCYVTRDLGGTIHFPKFLEMNNWNQKEIGLVAVSNFKDSYELYHLSQLSNNEFFRGVYSEDRESNEVLLSSVPKGIKPICYLNFNKDGYSKYCKDYREYWDWVKIRNQSRFEANVNNEKNYDVKNLMHTFRLLQMANEIAKEGKIIVRRSKKDRDFLLKIRNAEFDYDYLVQSAENLYLEVQHNFELSSLPDNPNIQKLEDVMIEMKKELYKI